MSASDEGDAFLDPLRVAACVCVIKPFGGVVKDGDDESQLS